MSELINYRRRGRLKRSPVSFLKVGDRVMFSDARWDSMSNDSRRMGRRAGVLKNISYTSYTYEGEFCEHWTVTVLWDGNKSLSDNYHAIEWFVPEDRSRICGPPMTRARRRKLNRTLGPRLARMNPECYPPLVVPDDGSA
jgi:hypothetical protein